MHAIIFSETKTMKKNFYKSYNADNFFSTWDDPYKLNKVKYYIHIYIYIYILYLCKCILFDTKSISNLISVRK